MSTPCRRRGRRSAGSARPETPIRGRPTVRNLLANPTPRSAIVVAKSIVVAIWALCITAWILVLGVTIGALVGLPGWSSDRFGQALASMTLAALLTIGLLTWVSFFAGVGRGFIAPLAWAVATIAAAQVLAVLGWGSWFPFSVPAIVAGAGGAQVEPVTPAAVGIVLIVAIGGLAATIAWWERADQTG